MLITLFLNGNRKFSFVIFLAFGKYVSLVKFGRYCESNNLNEALTLMNP